MEEDMPLIKLFWAPEIKPGPKRCDIDSILKLLDS
jgi:hypothetical protein